MSEDFERFREELNDQMDGGGCVEAWAAAQEQRDRDRRGSGGSRRSSTTEESAGPDTVRRSLLRGGAAAAMGTAMIGTAAGEARNGRGRGTTAVDDTRGETLDFADLDIGRSDVEQILADYAGGLLEGLSEHGYISEPHPAGLEFDDIDVGGRTRQDTLRLATGTHPEKGEYTVLGTRLPVNEFDKDVIVSVKPELDLAAASAVRNDEKLVFRTDTDGFQPQTDVLCWCTAVCSNCNCWWNFSEAERHCSNGYEEGCGSCTLGCSCW